MGCVRLIDRSRAGMGGKLREGEGGGRGRDPSNLGTAGVYSLRLLGPRPAGGPLYGMDGLACVAVGVIQSATLLIGCRCCCTPRWVRLSRQPASAVAA